MADKKELNGYSLHKQWFEFAFTNPDLITPAHGAIMSWLIELNNRMDWRDKFASPASSAMAATGISSYNTYKKVFTNLIEWGFITVLKESKNQYTACVIALSKFDKAEIEHSPNLPYQNLTEHGKMDHQNLTTQNESIVQSSDSIYKPENIKPIKKKTNTNLERAYADPSLSQVVVFFMENGYLKNEALKFYYYYSNLDWSIKNKKIKNWRHVAKTWQARKPDIEKEKYSAQKEKDNSDFLKRQFKAFNIDYQRKMVNYDQHKLVYAELLTKAIDVGEHNSFAIDLYLLASEIDIDVKTIVDSLKDLNNNDYFQKAKVDPDNKRLMNFKLTIWN